MGSSSPPIGLSPEQLLLCASLRFVPTETLAPQETVNPERANAVRQAISRDGFLRHPLYVTELYRGGPPSILDGHNRGEAFRRLGLRNVLVQYVGAETVSSSTWIQVVPAADPLLERVLRRGLRIADGGSAEPWRPHDVCLVHTSRRRYAISVPPPLAAKMVDCTRIITDALAQGEGRVDRIPDDELANCLERLDGRAAIQFRPLTLEQVLAAVNAGGRVGAGVTRFSIPNRIVDVDLPIGPWLNRPPDELNEMLGRAIEGSSPRKYCRHITEAGISWPDLNPDGPARNVPDPLAGKIGNTKLVPLKAGRCETGQPTVFAKCEFENLSGSSKARPADLMIREAGKGHLLDAGSGSTGQAEAEIAALLARELTVVVPENIPSEKMRAIKRCGATVLTSAAQEGSEGARALAMRIHAANPGKYVFLDQYSNTANWRSHLATADEIYAQTHGRVAHVFAGIGTGGTCMGLSRGLKTRNIQVKIHGVMPTGSDHRLYGLKFVTSANTPSILNVGELDEIIRVSDAEAYRSVRVLAREEGLIVGPSSGAVHAAWLSRRHLFGEDVVVLILHDTGEKYRDLLDFATADAEEYAHA